MIIEICQLVKTQIPFFRRNVMMIILKRDRVRAVLLCRLDIIQWITGLEINKQTDKQIERQT